MKVKRRRLNGWQRLSLVPLLLLAALMLVFASSLVHQGTAHAQSGFGACTVRGPHSSQPSAAPMRVGPPAAGFEFAIKTVSLTSDINIALAKCTDQVYKGLMGVYRSAGNTEPVQWVVAVYDENDNLIEITCAESGCEIHPPVGA